MNIIRKKKRHQFLGQSFAASALSLLLLVLNSAHPVEQNSKKRDIARIVAKNLCLAQNSALNVEQRSNNETVSNLFVPVFRKKYSGVP